MKLFSKSVVAAAFLATSLVSQYAAAASIPAPIGNIPVITSELNVKSDGEGGFNAHFGYDFLKADAGKTFTNDFTFTVGSQGLTTGSLTSSALRTKDLYISSFDLYSANGTLIAQGKNNNAGSNQTGMSDWWELPEATALSAGNYYLSVTGQVLGSAGGSYAGDIVMVPVPEPETYAMLLGGLGLIGAVARRRKANKAA